MSEKFIENPDKDYKLIIASEENDGEDVILTTAEKIQHVTESWMYDAMESFNKGGRQYSVRFNEDSTSTSSASETTIDDLKELAINAQSDLSKIRKINILVRQAENEDDIIGKVHESIESNLNANVQFTFDELPEDYDKKLKEKAKNVIKRFHKEINVNEIMTTSITSTYDEGNCILYLRSKKNKGKTHHVVDKYPLGVALISDYSLNSIPYVLIDTNELTNRLQKTTLKNKKNKPLFFKNTTEEIKNNYPKEVIDAYVGRERYAVLDIRRSGVNRFGNMGRTYGKDENNQVRSDLTVRANEIEGKVTDNENNITEIIQTNKQIQQSVTDANNNITKLQQDSQSFKQEVEKTYMTKNSLDSLKIGGRNLLRNSNTLEFEDYYFVGGTTSYVVDSDGNRVVDEKNNMIITI